MNNNTNTAEDLEIGTPVETTPVEATRPKPALVTAETKTQDRTVSDSSNKLSPYLTFESFRLDRLSQSANEGNSTSLFDRFQLRAHPDLPRSHAGLDLIATIFCFALVHFLYLGHLDLTSHRSIALFSALVFFSFSLYAGGMYNTKGLRSLNKELTQLTICWIFAFAVLGLFAFLTKTAADISRVWITSSMILSLTSLGFIRILSSLGLITKSEENAKNIVMLGNTININPVVRDLMNPSNSQIQVANIFDLPNHRSGPAKFLDSLEITSQQVSEYIEEQRKSGNVIEQVWIAVSENQSLIVEELSEALIDSSVDVCVVPDEYTDRLLKGDITRYGNTEIVNVSEVSLPLAAEQFKRVFDVTIASAALLFAGIPMMIIAALIKLESDGPVFFRQKRYGIDGREIDVLKFRSMYVHSDAKVQQAAKNDARVTRVGKVIRRTSLDELPQLLNVLNGVMSLVGPRPHAVAHNELWRQEIHGYMLRHKAKPGITGWAQVNGWRGETDTVYKMQQRVIYDLEYIRNWSPWLDIKIMFLTVFVGFYHKNAY